MLRCRLECLFSMTLARGGAVVSVVDELGIPIKFVGVGETMEDLQTFEPGSFVDALFPDSA